MFCFFCLYGLNAGRVLWGACPLCGVFRGAWVYIPLYSRVLGCKVGDMSDSVVLRTGTVADWLRRSVQSVLLLARAHGFLQKLIAKLIFLF